MEKQSMENNAPLCLNLMFMESSQVWKYNQGRQKKKDYPHFLWFNFLMIFFAFFLSKIETLFFYYCKKILSDMAIFQSVLMANENYVKKYPVKCKKYSF